MTFLSSFPFAITSYITEVLFIHSLLELGIDKYILIRYIPYKGCLLSLYF